ncbi:MAG TPA: LytTR family DNA-binding domain-containing protein [Bacteroidales bacterium]|nr:LytTR family DNA-binding domain-containing protein [Bacteroidales bacterium]HSA43657.1 LytTR family DNA-binding domain-containing protein [Bacteroidales bacterium]
MPTSNEQTDEILQLVKNFVEEQAGFLKLRFPTRNGILFLHPSEILYLTADNNYTHIHTTDGGTEITAQNLGKVHKALPQQHFIRINRSTVVNGRYLKRYDKPRKKCIIACNASTREFDVNKGL